jgi:hypothetical protein
MKECVYFKIPYILTAEFKEYKKKLFFDSAKEFDKFIEYFIYDKILKIYYIDYKKYIIIENEIPNKYKNFSLYIN